MPRSVFVEPSAPDEPTASSLRNVHARRPTATHGEPVLSSTGRPVARIDETDKHTQSFTTSTPSFSRKVPTWYPSCAEEAYPQNCMVGKWKNQSRKRISINSLCFLPSQDGGRASKQKRVLVLVSFWKQCVGSKKSRWLSLWTILRRHNQFEDIDSQILRCLMRASPPL